MRTLQQDFEAELTRLLASGLTQEEETIARRYYSDKERESMDESDFCGPHRTYPVKTQEDVTNAARLIGHADSPESVKKCVIGKAKTHGWSIPDAWQEEGKKAEERAMTAQQTLTRAANHEPMKGKHSHSHPAYGSQGDDGNHEHDHEHGKSGEPDNNHEPSDQHEHQDAAERTAEGTINAVAGEHFSLSFPIVRSDPKTWAVGGTCTAERPDRHGTIFSYEGAKGAFERWSGNVREQHDGKRAVAKRLAHNFDDEHQEVYLEAFISKTRPDTWERVNEGILNDFSVSVIPADEYGMDPRKWPKKEYNGKMYPYLPKYDYAEISLVDAGSLPGAHFVPLMRADGSYTEDLADLEEEAPAPAAQPLERAGKPISAANRAKIHDGIAHTLMAAKSQMQTCADAGCEDCAKAVKQLDPDDDDDIDAFGGSFGDTDGDAASLYGNGDDEMDRAVAAALERVLPGAIEHLLSPVYSRLQGIAGALARSHASSDTTTFETVVTGAITRAVEAATAAQKSSLDEVRADVSAVKGQVEKIAETPVPGAPVQNTGVAPRPVEKRLPDEYQYQPPQRYGSAVADAIGRMSEAGWLDTPERQADAMAAGLIAQRAGR